MPNTIEATLTASTGPAFVERDGKRIALNEGDSIYEADLIITGSETTIDISYRDGTRSRIGPDSEMRLVDFEFAPHEEPTFIVHLAQGAMRTVSGDIVKLNPEAFEIITPRATVGIRGTDFVTQVGEESDTHAVLYIKDGHIMLVTGKDGSSVTLESPLQMTTVDGRGGALQTQEYSLEQMQDLMNALSPSFGNNIPRSESEQGNFSALTRKAGNQEEQEEKEQEKKEKEEQEEDKSESSNQSDAPLHAENQDESENSDISEHMQNPSSSATEELFEETLSSRDGVDSIAENQNELNTLLTILKEAGIQVDSVPLASASSQNNADTGSVLDKVLEAEQAGNVGQNTGDTGSDGDTGSGDNTGTGGDTGADGDTGSGGDTQTDTSITGTRDTLSNGEAFKGSSVGDALTVTTMSGGTIEAYGGDDAITVSTMSGGTIDAGADNDTILVSVLSGDDETTIINAGDGIDSITVASMSGGTINAGDGNDTITITGTMSGGTINAGTGNDVIKIDTYTGGMINGGDGIDMLVTSDDTNFTISNIELVITGSAKSNELLSFDDFCTIYGVTVNEDNSITISGTTSYSQNNPITWTSDGNNVFISSDNLTLTAYNVVVNFQPVPFN